MVGLSSIFTCPACMPYYDLHASIKRGLSYRAFFSFLDYYFYCAHRLAKTFQKFSVNSFTERWYVRGRIFARESAGKWTTR